MNAELFLLPGGCPEPLQALVFLVGAQLRSGGSPRELQGELDHVWARFDEFHRDSLEPVLAALSQLDPPGELVRAQRELIYGAVRFQEALFLMEDYLVESRPADLRRAVGLLLEGASLLQTGLELVEEYLLETPGLLAVA